MANKNYVTRRNKEGAIISVSALDKDIQDIKERISEWKGDDSYELVEDPKTIEILNHMHRFDDDEDMQKRVAKLERVIEEIRNTVDGV